MKHALALVIAFLALAVPAQAAPFQWSAPQPFDTAPPHPAVQITGLDCPSVSLCVGVDAYGSVLASVDPTGGPAAWQSALEVNEGPGETGFSDVACASPTLCVAVGWSSISTSTNPTGGRSAWTTVQVPGAYLLNGVACPSSTLCVAVDGWGSIFSATNPTGGASAWQFAEKVNTSQWLRDVSCPSVDLCVAVGGSFVTSTTNPTGGKAAWKNTLISGSFLDDVDCPTKTSCVTLDDGRRVGTSSNPTGDATAWTFTQSTLGRDLSCPTTTLCVASTTAPGTLAVATDPSAPWKPAIVSADPVTAIDCPTAALCVAGDTEGRIITSTTPLAGPWATAQVNFGRNQTSAIDCASPDLCVAVNSSGSALSSTTPGAAGTWTSRVVSAEHRLYDVACPSAALCVAVDDDGGVVTSTTPAAGNWTRAAVGSGLLTAVACASPTLCVGANPTGYLGTSSNPAGGAGAWSVAQIPGAGGLTGSVSALDCPSTTLCVGVDWSGRVLSSTAPAGGAATWKLVNSPANTLVDVDCPSVNLCFAVGPEGDIVRSTDPAGPASSWTLATDLPEGLLSIGCASETVCVAGGYEGTLYELDGSAWKPAGVARPNAIQSISCPSEQRCLAVTQGGRLVVGTGASAPPLPAPVVQRGAASSIATNAATLHGTVESSAALTACRFELVGGASVACTRSGSAVTATFVGLQPSTTYRWRLVAESAAGRTDSDEGQFTTAQPAQESVPDLVVTPPAVVTPEPTPTAPRPAEITARALADLAPKGSAAKLGTIVKRKGYAQSTTALTAGTATVKWFTTVKGKKVLIATGTQTYAGPGTKVLTVKLNAKGRKLLAKAKRLTVQAELTFTPTGGPPVTAKRKLVLKR